MHVKNALKKSVNPRFFFYGKNVEYNVKCDKIDKLKKIKEARND